jgi:hypothetical protein
MIRDLPEATVLFGERDGESMRQRLARRHEDDSPSRISE